MHLYSLPEPLMLVLAGLASLVRDWPPGGRSIAKPKRSGVEKLPTQSSSDLLVWRGFFTRSPFCSIGCVIKSYL